MNIILQSKNYVLNRTLRLRRLWTDRSQLEYQVVRSILVLAYLGCVFAFFLMALSAM